MSGHSEQRAEAGRSHREDAPLEDPTRSYGAGARAALALLLLYFAARLVFLALHVSPELPPDERTHVGLARHAQSTLLRPADNAQSYEHGLIAHRPFLYSWTMARWLALRPGADAHAGPEQTEAAERRWLRLGNAVLALASAGAALAWARAMGLSSVAQLLFLAALTNTPMWSFLSASVNYDNLAILLAWTSYLLLLRTDTGAHPTAALALGALLGVGVLTKVALLPLAALLVVALALMVALPAPRGSVRRLPAAFASALRVPRPAFVVAALIFATATSASLWLYGGNLVRFGVLEPAAHQVLPLDAAKQNRIFLQEYVLRSYRAGAPSFDEARREIAGIRHAGDRAGAQWMLERARELRGLEQDPTREGDPLLGRVAYARVWLGLMGERIAGIMGHREMYKHGAWAWTYLGIALAAAIALAIGLVRGVPGIARRHLVLATATGAAYALLLMQAVNYPIYLRSGLDVEAVQGRYLFPVFAPLLSVGLAALLALFPRALHVGLALALAAFFIAGDFPYFMQHADGHWLPGWKTLP